MATMNSELYHALREAGAPHEHADAAARATPSVEQSASKTDAAEMKSDLRAARSELHSLRWVVTVMLPILLAGLIFVAGLLFQQQRVISDLAADTTEIKKGLHVIGRAKDGDGRPAAEAVPEDGGRDS